MDLGANLFTEVAEKFGNKHNQKISGNCNQASDEIIFQMVIVLEDEV